MHLLPHSLTPYPRRYKRKPQKVHPEELALLASMQKAEADRTFFA